MYNGKYLKTKIKSVEGKINTNFHDHEMAKRRFSLQLFISNIDWFFKVTFKIGKKTICKFFLEEFEYIVKKKKIHRHIRDELETSSDDSDEEISDKELTDV